MIDMKKYLLFGAAALSSLFSSCYYDPFLYGNSHTSASFGVSSFGGNTSTSFFVSTGDPRWAYDSYRFCYFDRYRSCYYDPFLYGYYPVGFLPAPIVGCPHPFGWSGRGYCPPPQRIRNHTLSRYDNRISNYQAANYHWARRANAIGTSSWASSSERNQLRSQSLQSTSFRETSTSPSWQNGGLNRAPQMNSFSPSRTDSSAGLRGARSNWNQPTWQSNSRARTQSISPQETPMPQRPASSGMFGGLDRGGNQRAERTPAFAPSAAPAERSAPREDRDRDLSSPSMPSINSGNSWQQGGGLRSQGGGGGLRQFQR
jgi:hypothetical protein